VSNVHTIPVPESEPYVSRAQLAEHMGVSVDTIDRLVKQGMPSETWGRRTRRFRPSIAIAWARGQGLPEAGDCAA
jgi:phage terminase Nu1 subunit (DNA packaging protein)